MKKQEQEINPEFVNELAGIFELLNARDKESQYLGYNLLRQSDFKKFMKGKLFTRNNKSFYRLWLYKLNLKPSSTYSGEYKRHFHNENKLNFAYQIIAQYLRGELKIANIKPKLIKKIK